MKTLTKDARGFIDEVSGYIAQEKGGRALLPKVESLLTRVTAQAKKEQTAHVTSAVALGASEKSAIARALERLLGHEVSCEYGVDAEILGGIKIQVADWVVDSSFATQLKQIAQSLQ